MQKKERKVAEEMSFKRKGKATVISQRQIAGQIYDLWIQTDLAQEARAGQFLALYPHNESTLLPRPISICETDAQREAIRMVYRIAGKGTAEFAEYQAGDALDVLGVLGNGFPLEKAAGKRVLLMGGGIGIPPMLELSKELAAQGTSQLHVVAGYRDQECFLKEDLERYAAVSVATEDGSIGVTGNVLDAVREEKLEGDIIMACGPMPMLRAIKQYALEKGLEAYISLEERMACGVGACLGCVCRTKEKDAHSHVNNARICTDGPVFDAREVEI